MNCACPTQFTFYNNGMWKPKLLLLLLGAVLAGCADNRRNSEFERMSREIQRMRAEAERQRQTAGGPGGNIRIDVKLLTTTLEQYSAVEVLWRYVDRGTVAISRPETFAQAGLRIGVANDDFEVQLNIAKKELQTTSESLLFLVVADGTEGMINIGTEIAVPVFYYQGRRYSGVQYAFRQAGRSLLVFARSTPTGTIELELTPVFSDFLNSGGDLKLTELSPTVRVLPRQTVVLGGSSSSSQDVATALFGRRQGQVALQSLMTVTAYYQ